MDVILNIGLARAGKPNLNIGQILGALRAACFSAASTEVFQSDTEPTAVIVAYFPETKLSFFRQATTLANFLDQDCVACYVAEFHRGELIGPKAAEWGTFNPEFFILPDGTRLQPSKETAK